MIRVRGNTIEVVRYKVLYDMGTVEMMQEAATVEEAEQIAAQTGGKIEAVDTAGIEWIDGVQIPDTKAPMEEALKILEMGEEGYKKWLEQQAAQSPEKLAEENEKLKQQLTDIQLALVEVYEMMLPS